MYLQLAENGTDQQKKIAVTDPFIYLPPVIFKDGTRLKGTFVREDYFDDLNNEEWKTLMKQLAPYQPKGLMSDGNTLADRASRKAKRADKKAQKAADKQAKQDAKKAKAETKAEIKKARGESRAEGLKNIGNVLGAVVKGVAGGLLPGGIPGAGAEAIRTDQSGSPGDYDPPSDDMETPWYKTTGGMIGIGAGVLIVGGTVWYFATKDNE